MNRQAPITRQSMEIFTRTGGGGGVAAATVVTVTGSIRTLTSADHNKILDCVNPGGCRVTVPLGLVSGTGVPFLCWLSWGEGGGRVTVEEGEGCTVEAVNGWLALDEQFGRMTLMEWPDGTFRLFDGTATPIPLSWPAAPVLEYRPSEGIAAKGVMPRHGSTVPVNDVDMMHLVKGTGVYLNTGGCTATYGSDIGPEGQQTAHRIVSPGGASVGIFQFPYPIPTEAGQPYTFTWAIRTSPGATATQTLRGGPTVDFVDVTATATWQTITKTVTPSVATNYSFWITRNNAAEGAFDVLIDNIRVVKGATVSAYPAVDGHVVFGPGKGDPANPTFAGGVIAHSTVAGVIELAAPKTFTELTLMFASKHLTDIVSTYSPVLSAGTYTNFFGGIGSGLNGGGAQFMAAGSVAGPYAVYTCSKGKGWMTIGFRIKDGKQNIFVNGAIYEEVELVAPFPGFTNKFMEMFGLGGTENIIGHPGDLGPVVLFDSYLNDTQVDQADRYLRAVAEETPGIAFTEDMIVLYGNGDSITNQNSFVGATGSVGSHIHRIFKARPTQLTGSVVATDGLGMLGIAADLDNWQLSSMQHLVEQGQNVIFTPLTGANNYANLTSDPTAFYNDILARLLRPARAVGAKVIAQTVLPREDTGGAVGHNAGRAIVNDLFRAHPEEYDALADFDTKPVGQDGAPAARVLYIDGTHPNGLGYDDMEAVEVTALDAVIESLA